MFLRCSGKDLFFSFRSLASICPYFRRKAQFLNVFLTVFYGLIFPQSPTSLLPMTLVCSLTSFSVRMRWSMTVEKQSILVWPEFVKMTLGDDFCWKIHGQLSWRLGWIVPVPEKSLFTTMNCKAHFIFLNRIWSMEYSQPMCEFVISVVFPLSCF